MSVDYGLDLACVSDLDTTLTETAPGGRRIVAEAVARRLQTPRGRLIGDPNYGFDLVGYCNDDLNAGGLAWIQSQVVAECLKDERVTEAACELELDAGDVMTATISLRLVDDPDLLSLVLAVSVVTVEILSVE